MSYAMAVHRNRQTASHVSHEGRPHGTGRIKTACDDSLPYHLMYVLLGAALQCHIQITMPAFKKADQPCIVHLRMCAPSDHSCVRMSKPTAEVSLGPVSVCRSCPYHACITAEPPLKFGMSQLHRMPPSSCCRCNLLASRSCRSQSSSLTAAAQSFSSCPAAPWGQHGGRRAAFRAISAPGAAAHVRPAAAAA